MPGEEVNNFQSPFNGSEPIIARSIIGDVKKPKRIPIKDLKELSKKYGLTQAVLLGYDGELEHVVTYGSTKKLCRDSAGMGQRLKELLGWPKSAIK